MYKIRLLIVEDDTATLKLYSSIIRHAFPELLVHEATNPNAAIALFKQHHHEIILSDLKVPNRNDGIAIAREVCHERPDTIIFLITADSSTIDPGIKSNIMHLCVEGILGKPVDVRLMISVVTEAIATITLSANKDSHLQGGGD